MKNADGQLYTYHADKPWGNGDSCCVGAGMQCICTVGGYFGYMKDLYSKTYKKLGVPEKNDQLRKISSIDSPPEFDKIFRNNFDKILA